MSHVAQATEAPTPSLDDNVSTQPAQSQASGSSAAQVSDASTANLTNSGHSVAGDLPDQQTEDGQGEPAELEVDDTELEDSALGGDTESITQSIDSTVYNFREEFGRTYHGYKDGKYYLPNDESESDRLDFMHAAFNLTYGKKLFLSPVEKLENALDIGTGTGIWAIDLADEYPQCQVIGTDLSPSQPDLVPPNVKFMVDDAEDSWVFSKQFDLIHARLMAGSFADWPFFFREAYKNLEPGGWLELQEYEMPVSSQDGTHEGTNIQKWGELLCESSKILGRPMSAEVCAMFEQQMRDAGFVDVQRRNFIWPTNPWPKDPLMKELGLRTLINCTDGMEGFCLALYTRALGWKKEEVDVFVAMVKKDFKDRKIHAFIPMPVFLGRKPHPHETTSVFS